MALGPLLLTASMACVLPAPEIESQTRLPYATFDLRSGPQGWRSLSGRGCTDEAVALLSAYAGAHAATLPAPQRRELAFHTGQVLALAGRNAEAIPHFELAQGADASPEWRAYVAATLAFLRRDSIGLRAARDDYARLAAPGSTRLRIVEGLLACPTRPYAAAAHCRP